MLIFIVNKFILNGRVLLKTASWIAPINFKNCTAIQSSLFIKSTHPNPLINQRQYWNNSHPRLKSKHIVSNASWPWCILHKPKPNMHNSLRLNHKRCDNLVDSSFIFRSIVSQTHLYNKLRGSLLAASEQ